MNAGEQGYAPSESMSVAHAVGLETLVEHESCLHPAPASRALDVASMSYEQVRTQAGLLSRASLNGLNRDRAIAVCRRAMQLLPAPVLLSDKWPDETASDHAELLRLMRAILQQAGVEGPPGRCQLVQGDLSMVLAAMCGWGSSLRNRARILRWPSWGNVVTCRLGSMC